MSKLGDFFNRLADEGEAFQEALGNEIVSELASMAAEEVIKTAGDVLSGSPGSENINHQDLLKPPCGLDVEGFEENRVWSFGLTNGEPNPFTLAVPTDHFTESQALTVISPGEYYRFVFQVLKVGEGGNYAHAIQFSTMAGTLESSWLIHFAPGRDEVISADMRLDNEFQNDEFEVSGYLPGQRNEVLLFYEQGEGAVKMLLNREHLSQWLVPGALTSRPVKIRVVGMDVFFWGN